MKTVKLMGDARNPTQAKNDKGRSEALIIKDACEMKIIKKEMIMLRRERLNGSKIHDTGFPTGKAQEVSWQAAAFLRCEIGKKR